MEQRADIPEWKHGYLCKRIKRAKAFPVYERGLEGSCEILFSPTVEKRKPEQGKTIGVTSQIYFIAHD